MRTKKTESLVEEIPLFLRDEDNAMVRVGKCFFDEESREIRVRLTEYLFAPRELASLADQSRIACERLLEESK